MGSKQKQHNQPTRLARKLEPNRKLVPDHFPSILCAALVVVVHSKGAGEGRYQASRRCMCVWEWAYMEPLFDSDPSVCTPKYHVMELSMHFGWSITNREDSSDTQTTSRDGHILYFELGVSS